MATRFTIATSGGRRALVGIAITSAVLAVAAATPAAAAADCTASGLARTISAVSGSTADYLDAHPDVNDAFTRLKGESRPQMRADAQQYLDANPAVRSDLKNLRAPLNEFAQRCGVSLPQGPLGG
jgi:hemophore-related protein